MLLLSQRWVGIMLGVASIVEGFAPQVRTHQHRRTSPIVQASFFKRVARKVVGKVKPRLFPGSEEIPTWKELRAQKARSSKARRSVGLKYKSALLIAVTRAKLEGTYESEEKARRAFEELERALPAPSNLVDSDDLALLDGRWDLLYTIAAYAPEPGSEESRRGETGKVNATGLQVDTAGDGVQTSQTFDLESARVSNNIVRPITTPFGEFFSSIEVSGPFSPSPYSGIRADVAFDRLVLGLGIYSVTIDWLFPLIYSLKGSEDFTSWLDTTHISDDMRLGRGNKGSIFVLTRSVVQ